MTYPKPYIKKALQKLEDGQSIREVAEELKISTRTLQNWKKNPNSSKRRNRKSIRIDKQALIEDVKNYPDAYQYEGVLRFNCKAWAIGKA